MLRFDLPRVWSHVIRWDAFVTFCFCVAAWFVSPWLLVVPAMLGLVRGFFGHHRDPVHGAFSRMFQSRGWAGKLEDVGAKMFAAKILFLASTVALALAVSGSGLWRVPTAVLMVFSTLEWAFAFCAGCWAYGAWYKRFPPTSA
jgi:hypothetical protein